MDIPKLSTEPSSMEQLDIFAPLTGVVITQMKIFTETGFKTSYKIEDLQGQALIKDKTAKVYDLSRLCSECRSKIYWRKVHQKYNLEHGARLCDVCEKQLEPLPVESTYGLDFMRWWYGNSGQRAVHLQNHQGEEILHVVASQQTVMHGWTSQFSRVVVKTAGDYLGEVNEQHGLLGSKGSFVVTDATGPVIQIRNMRSYLPWGNKFSYMIRSLDSLDDIGEISLISKASFDGYSFSKYRLTFPEAMNVRHKALLIGAAILLDFKTA